jgi:YYY domain-containing protein
VSYAGALLSVWFTMLILGASVLPLSTIVFQNLPGRGYFASKILGLLATSYITWLSAHCGLLPLGKTSVLISVALCVGLSITLWLREKQWFRDTISSQLSHMVRVEMLFIAVLTLFTFIKSYNSNITPSSEGFMDFALLKNILRGGEIPLNDPWFSGEKINYYYFGHLSAAVVNHLSGLDAEVFYNIGVALFFAILAVGSFSLGYSFTGRSKYGLLVLLFVVFVGNLDGLIQLVQTRSLLSFDWFRSSRIIPGTINEFPYFSFLWGDLHAYVLAFPIAILILLLSYNLLISNASGFKMFGENHLTQFLHICILGLSLGTLFLAHPWDYPTYTFILVSTIFIQQWGAAQGRVRNRISQAILPAGTVVVVSILLCLPHFGSFQQSREILMFADKTTTRELLTIFGFFLFAMVSLLVGWFYHDRESSSPFPMVPFTVSTAFVLARYHAVAFLGILIVVVIYALQKNLTRKRMAYCLLLLGTGAGLGLGGEFFYVNDHFGPPIQRINTIFKLYLQIWICWAIAAGLSVYLIRESLTLSGHPNLRKVWMGLLVLGTSASLIYPFAATYQRTGNFANMKSLNVLGSLRRHSIADHDAITWINRNVRGKPVILETTGKPYTWNARISSFTGLPTVLGWGNHEAGWRNDWEGVLQRTDDIHKIYSTDSLLESWALMSKYKVEYVYIGSLENHKYSEEGLAKFGRFMELVYSSTNVQIYRINES